MGRKVTEPETLIELVDRGVHQVTTEVLGGQKTVRYEVQRVDRDAGKVWVKDMDTGTVLWTKMSRLCRALTK